jgi:NTP pyrophosphatase (non-canonical NTP hydrolase)
MKYSYEQLLNRSYKAIQERGLINQNTTLDDFFDKIDEERDEVIKASDESDKRLKEELNDLSTVCQMCIMWLNGNPIKEFEKGVEKNEQRARNKKDSK